MDDKSAAGTRMRLLEQGLGLVTAQGFRHLSVRQLCQHAGVNTGSFVYHFGQREHFVAELIEHWYAPIFNQVQLDFSEQASSQQRLHTMLVHLVHYLSLHGPLIAQIMLDAAAGEAAVIEFLRSLNLRHPRLVLECLRQAQADGFIEAGDPLHQMLFVFSAMSFPVFLQHAIAGRPVVPAFLQQSLDQFAAAAEHIEQRLNWALKGLQPRETSL